MKIYNFNQFINESTKIEIETKKGNVEISCAYDLDEKQINLIKHHLNIGQYEIKNGVLYGTQGQVWIDSYGFNLWQGDKNELMIKIPKRLGSNEVSLEPIYVK